MLFVTSIQAVYCSAALNWVCCHVHAVVSACVGTRVRLLANVAFVVLAFIYKETLCVFGMYIHTTA